MTEDKRFSIRRVISTARKIDGPLPVILNNVARGESGARRHARLQGRTCFDRASIESLDTSFAERNIFRFERPLEYQRWCCAYASPTKTNVTLRATDSTESVRFEEG